ncbi:PH domain-like protein [Ascobolus immersus RN42]|uniref:PH domain-like protein n=1 Tax=Ascobolus immersus RN42 TaxID=1160509 RepID=A0A3N4I4V3_ASCIM|nr:PH domain-like protein [Ascobolus immersus RN42]
MPSLLTKEDKLHVKRVLPSSSNHIITGAIARLYISYPDPSRWTFTGISGALVLVEDTVAKAHFLKIVDISPSNLGVLWDIECYKGFKYVHDRTYFHSFEMEECMGGFSFADSKEAGNFFKKVEGTLRKR